MLVSDIKVGDNVSFKIFTNSVLVNEYIGVKVLAVAGFDIAKLWGDPVALHQNIYSALPEGAIDDPESYDYLLIKLASGETTIIGTSWIRSETLEVTGTGKLTIEIEDVKSTDLEAVQKALAANGFRVVKTEFSNLG